MASDNRQSGSAPNGRGSGSGENPGGGNRWLAVVALFGLVLLFSYFADDDQPRQAVVEIPYSQFKSLVADGEVGRALFTGRRIEGQFQAPLTLDGITAARFRSRMPDSGDVALLPLLEAHGVRVEAEPGRDEGGSLLLSILPWLLFIAVYLWIWRRMSRGVGGLGGGRFGRGGELGRFLQVGRRGEPPPDIGFDDVAGQDNAKREVAELIDCLHDPERYRRLGADIPRGVLLMGPPGTGKTLLARALAGEAGVPFFSLSASEFIEMYVGVGASRVRKLFEDARKAAPSIVFIDELDSVGRVRGAGLGGGHDEREQTLNQILAELDGFSGHEAVIVLAATNRPDVLDPALLRPGRFDRHVTLDLPDRQARAAILGVHLRRVPTAADVEPNELAAGTPGFSGADLKNLVNEAAMHAARGRRETVCAEDFEVTRDRVLLGSERKLVMQAEERHRLAVHESGHALSGWFLPGADPLHKVTIIPRGRALGATEQLPSEERYTLPRDYLRDRLAVLLGGRGAERALLGSVSSGADDDIRQATRLARAMVARWGMSERIGPVDLRDADEHPFLGREIAQPRRHSEHSARAVDEAVCELLGEAEARVAELIAAHREPMDALVAALETRETLYRGEVAELLGAPAAAGRARDGEVAGGR